MSQMSYFLEKWYARSFACCGSLLLLVAISGCNPPVDKPDPAKPEVTPSDETPATSEAEPAEEMSTDEAPAPNDAAAETPTEEPAETAVKDPLDTTDTSSGVKLGVPEDPVNLKD